ncbi:CHK domain-containing protein [Aphelenchoides besseyi]|nr:CHK domain-containing protein [Aphelenchoides besseyi]
MTVTNDLHVLPTVPLSSELSNTGYTIHWTLKMLHDHNPTFVKARGDKQVKDITAYDISKGYLSHVYKTTVTFDSGDTYRFIMKVPTFQCLEKAMDDMGLEKSDSNRFQDELKDAHNLECTAYELIRDVVDFPKPHVYFTQRTGEGNPGLIVMNDLSETATTIGIFKSITVDHCINAARHFATFHAQMNSRNDWKGKFEKNFHCSSFNRFEMPKMCQKFIDEAPEFTETVKKMRRVDYINFSRYALMELPKRYGKIILYLNKSMILGAITLLNGDCWTNNVMIKLSEDGSLSNEIARLKSFLSTHKFRTQAFDFDSAFSYTVGEFSCLSRMPVFDSMDENLQFDGTGYTMTFVLKKLSENCPEFSQKMNESTIESVGDIWEYNELNLQINSRDLSAFGQGNLSRVLKLTIDFTDTHVKPHKVILKLPTLERISEACDQMELLEAAINTTPDLKQKSKNLKSTYHLHCNSRNLINTFFSRWCARKPSFEWFAEKFQTLNMEALSHYALIGLSQEYDADMTNNLLLKQNPDGTATNEISAVIDFQLSFYGNPLFDLARLIQICVESSMRRKIEKSVVDVYYNALRRAYKKRGYKQPPFSREQASFLFYIT